MDIGPEASTLLIATGPDLERARLPALASLLAPLALVVALGLATQLPPALGLPILIAPPLGGFVLGAWALSAKVRHGEARGRLTAAVGLLANALILVSFLTNAVTRR